MSAPRFSKDQKHEIVRRFVAGERLKSIAEAFGCDPSYPWLLAGRWGGEEAISARRTAIAGAHTGGASMKTKPLSYRTRMMLRAATTRASATHTIGGTKKTLNAPKPVTLPKTVSAK